MLAVAAGGELFRFNAGQPQRLLPRVALQGPAAGEQVLGIDFRVGRGVPDAPGRSGRLDTVDVAAGKAGAVGGAAPAPPAGARFGVDFNPVADRVRVVSDSGQDLRLHPDNGALAATDPAPAYADGDSAKGRAPRVAAAGDTYHKHDDRLTTHYAIDLDAATLVTQGTKEGVAPAVSPNTGRLFTVGALGTGPLEAASLDIADVDNSALAARRRDGRTRLYAVDLARGRATAIGTVADGAPLRGLAVEP